MLKEIMKVTILILIPINAWLLVIWYIKKQQIEMFLPSIERHISNTEVRINYFQERLGLQPGKKLVYPFPAKLTLLGKVPPVGQGYPVLFINIDWLIFPEVWEPAIKTALQASPNLHIVLLHSLTIDFDPVLLHSPQADIIKREWNYAKKQQRRMLEYFRSKRISILSGEWIRTAFGGQFGILAFLCDSNGVVRAIEFYPSLKISSKWSEEIADWRPKLHQAVKKVLDKFFAQRQRSVR